MTFKNIALIVKRVSDFFALECLPYCCDPLELTITNSVTDILPDSTYMHISTYISVCFAYT